MKQCPKCGVACADTDTYCGLCGTLLPPPTGRGDGASPTHSGNGMAIASLVLGIVGLCSSWCVVGVVPGLLAIIFSLIVLLSASRRANVIGMAVAGLILGAMAILIAIFILVLFVGIGQRILSSRDFSGSNTNPDFSQSSSNAFQA